MRVQVIYATRHGATAGIAQRIADVLESEGVAAVVADAADEPLAGAFQAHVVGSGVHMGSWFKEAIQFLETNRALLAGRPVWLFSSGPLPGSSKAVDGSDRLTQALGPEDGPGSGGRKRITELSAAIRPREHRVFDGAYDPQQPPASLAERVVRFMPASRKVLPAGDFRDWDAIEAWARGIAAALRDHASVA
jgi:menaquinone-dependent protoporphyrinogen oxidase